jgi:hypothetical protein
MGLIKCVSLIEERAISAGLEHTISLGLDRVFSLGLDRLASTGRLENKSIDIGLSLPAALNGQ